MSSQPDTPNSRTAVVDQLRNRLSKRSFRSWYDKRKYRLNIENGTPYFNGSDTVPEPERLSPSKLLQCHRKIFYRQHNAPEEQSDPTGVFWFGTRFEEDLVFPYLRETLTDKNTFVRNSVWIDFTVETDVGDIRIKGATDPLIVDANAVPVFPSEIKTKSSVDNIDSPNSHHRAQLHAYMHGLNRKYDIDLDAGVILYGSRESLNVKSFEVEFDPDFWKEAVLNWAQSHTEFRLNDTLPPAEPEYNWECRFCSYRERCGQGETDVSDVGPYGLLPSFVEYPEEKLWEYFDAYPDARLPPTLASHFPAVAAKHDVYDWWCPACLSTIDHDRTESITELPVACPNCRSRDVYSELVSPRPAQQRQIDTDSTEGETNA